MIEWQMRFDLSEYERRAFQRFMSKVRVSPTGCWLWQGSLGRGYGQLSFRRRTTSAHRLSYLFFFGEPPGDLLCCHSCDVRACVNPTHIWLGTYSDNARDCAVKWRNAAQTRPESRARGERQGSSVLTASSVLEIRSRYAAGDTHRGLAKAFGISKTQAGRLIRGESWRHLR